MSPVSVKKFRPRSMETLTKLLKLHNVPIEKYGIGLSLPLQALYDQVQDGRVTLKEQSKKLVRSLEVASINLYFRDGKKLLHLIEGRQVRIDPETREDIKSQTTHRKLRWSIARKMLPGNSSLKKAVTALESELQLTITPSRLENEHFYVFYRESIKFPGLNNHVRVTEYDLFLESDEFQPKGYVYEDKYLRSYFVWKKVPNSRGVGLSKK